METAKPYRATLNCLLKKWFRTVKNFAKVSIKLSQDHYGIMPTLY